MVSGSTEAARFRRLDKVEASLDLLNVATEAVHTARKAGVEPFQVPDPGLHLDHVGFQLAEITADRAKVFEHQAIGVSAMVGRQDYPSMMSSLTAPRATASMISAR